MSTKEYQQRRIKFGLKTKPVGNCCAKQKHSINIFSFNDEIIIHLFSLTAGLPLNGHCHPVQHLNGGDLTRESVNGNSTEVENGDRIGNVGVSLNLGFFDNGLHTAENMEDASSQIEHRKSVSVEEQYDHITFNTMHLYHGC
ncbi:hypothetical protein DPX16_4627 [Anabarilius grahami]|uniref:Uncharacterized protein n=1 Tax=Anabarilius grahami TaxID=495550 RepID=A0A3N0YC22_ANAGA|nr:hypothetical protein DPX16_4627 [Anabarilius grahami]